MTASTDQMLEHLQQKVFALIGKCILNLQIYEHRLKALLPTLEITISPEGKLDQRDLSMSTLGNLINEFTNKAISPEGSTLKEEEPELNGEFSFRMKTSFSSSYPQEHYERTREDLAALLKQRNFLVHHFYAKYPLADRESCEAAEVYLQELNRMAWNSLSELKDYSGHLRSAQAALVEALQDPNVSCRILQVTPNKRQEWEAIREVHALREAEQLKGADGFTSLEKAILSIQTEIAEDAYKAFGLSSWQQFIQESGLFEQVRRKNPETQRWERWYKSKG